MPAHQPPKSAAAAAPAPGAAPPLPRRRKEVRPQQLLDAALALFVEKGFAATRAEEVARRAGASKGTLYLYYPSKEELFKAVVRQSIGKLLGEAGELVAGAESNSPTLMRTLLLTWWERVGSSAVGGLHKVMLAEARNFPELAQFYADEVVVPARSLFEGLIRRGVERGEFRPVDVCAVTLAVISPMLFLMLHRHSFGACAAPGFEIDPDATLAAHIDLVLQGLRADGAAAPEAPRAAGAQGRGAAATRGRR